MRLRNLFTILVLMTYHGAVRADCLKVSEPEVEMVADTVYGELVTATWVAMVVNECNSPYDGTLRVRFFMEDGYSAIPHESVEFIILSAGETREAAVTIDLPAGEATQITRTEVEITERERPL